MKYLLLVVLLLVGCSTPERNVTITCKDNDGFKMFSYSGNIFLEFHTGGTYRIYHRKNHRTLEKGLLSKGTRCFVEDNDRELDR